MTEEEGTSIRKNIENLRRKLEKTLSEVWHRKMPRATQQHESRLQVNRTQDSEWIFREVLEHFDNTIRAATDVYPKPRARKRGNVRVYRFPPKGLPGISVAENGSTHKQLACCKGTN